MVTTASYGTWTNTADSMHTTVENTVAAALGPWAVDYDVDAIVRDYRDAINAALPDGVSLCGDEFIGPARKSDQDFGEHLTDCDGHLDIRATVETVDLWVIVEQHENGVAVWSLVRGASPDALAVEPDVAGVTVPADVLAWAEANGLDASDPDVYLLVTPLERADLIAGEIATTQAAMAAADMASLRVTLADQE